MNKYPKIKQVANLEDQRVYNDGAVYLPKAGAEALEAALNTAATPSVEASSEVLALNTQLEAANTNLATAQTRIAELEASNATLQAEKATLQAENSRLGKLPAGSDAAALAGTALEEQPAEGAAANAETNWADPELEHNKAAIALGIPIK